MAATIQIKRRTGAVGSPATLALGELAYNDPSTATVSNPDALYIGSNMPAANTIKLLVGNTRQVEIAGAQTITGIKTMAIGNFKLTGGAATNIITTDGAGNLSFSAAPGGGITAVAHDTTMTGDGNAVALSVVHLATARHITLQATGGTSITAASPTFDGSADAIISGFEVIGLDGGTF